MTSQTDDRPCGSCDGSGTTHTGEICQNCPPPRSKSQAKRLAVQKGEPREFVTRQKKVMAQQFWPEVKPWPKGIIKCADGWIWKFCTVHSGEWIVEGYDKPMTNEEFEREYETS